MIHYILSFFVGICILLSWVGWGTLINRILFPDERIDWGQHAAWGIAFSCGIGGILNFFKFISQTTILIYLGLGLLWFLITLYKRLYVADPSFFHKYKVLNEKLFFAGILIVWLLILLQYSVTVSPPQNIFNRHDDFQAYFVFPHQMLQTGALGADPFCTRRLSILGGHQFLQTFLLSMLSEKAFFILDPGLALIVITALLIGYLNNYNLTKVSTFILLLFFLSMPFSMYLCNTSAFLLSAAVFLSFFRTLEWEGLHNRNFVANSFIIALLSSALCSLKPTNVPIVIIFLGVSYFFYILRSNAKKRIYELCIAIVFTILFLLPWMLSMYQSSGTLLYPLLGKGYHGSAYGTYLSSWLGMSFGGVMKIFWFSLYNSYLFLFILITLIGIVTLIIHPRQRDDRGAFLSLLISSGSGVLILLFATGGRDFIRFSFPFIYSTIIISMIKLSVDFEKVYKSIIRKISLRDYKFNFFYIYNQNAPTIFKYL